MDRDSVINALSLLLEIVEQAIPNPTQEVAHLMVLCELEIRNIRNDQ